MQDGVDHLTIRHLPDLDQADEHCEFQAVVHSHPDDFFRTLNVTEWRTLKVRHG